MPYILSIGYRMGGVQFLPKRVVPVSAYFIILYLFFFLVLDIHIPVETNEKMFSFESGLLTRQR